MKVSFGGIGECVATFYNSQTNPAVPGQFVKISASGEVAACAAGDSFAGLCISADGHYAAVQVSGFITAAFTGTAPAFGHTVLAAADSKSVKTNAAGVPVLVIERDTNTIGFML